MFIVAANITAAQGSQSIGKICKTYTGREDERITLLRIGEHGDNECLVEVGGVDHTWDGRVFKAKVTLADKKTEYTISCKEKAWVILRAASDNEGNTSYTLFLPRESNMQLTEIGLKYAPELTGVCKPEWLLSAYKKQMEGKKMLP